MFVTNIINVYVYVTINVKVIANGSINVNGTIVKVKVKVKNNVCLDPRISSTPITDKKEHVFVDVSELYGRPLYEYPHLHPHQYYH